MKHRREGEKDRYIDIEEAEKKQTTKRRSQQ
jgi:hypothetical protein